MNTNAFGQPEGPIAAVREGMRVVDRAEQSVGTVEAVKMGDPEAVTPQGQAPAQSGLVAGLNRALGEGEPKVPAALAARLMRVGFVKVDGKGLLDRDFYVSSEQVAAVSGDVVHLTASRDELIREG